MKSTVVVLLKRLLLLLAFYSFARFFYFTYNQQEFANSAAREIMSAFAQGVRFDIAAILKLNFVFFLFWLLPARFAHHGPIAKAMRVLFYLVNGVFLTLNFVDAELVKFSGQRVTLNYFATSQDVGNQLPQLARYYWFIALVSLASIALVVRFLPMVKPQLVVRPQSAGQPPPIAKKIEANARGQAIGMAFMIIALMVLGVRGGLQDKPLRPAHAYKFTQGALGQLALNSTFTLIQSGKSAEQNKLHFMSDEEVATHLQRDRTRHFTSVWPQPQNVVIFIIESLASEYTGAVNGGEGYTPFFDSLAKQGLLFKNGFANGRRSLEALPSILASVPSLLRDPFLTSNFQGTQVVGLGQVLQKHGYETAFFHGAANGSMFFDSFSARAGFREYYGLNEYPDRKRDYDGFWGIFDEPFFNFALTKMHSFKKPFAVTLFSLSSHQPYTVPSAYAGQFPKGSLEIHESIGYVDHALKQFFAAAEKEPWYQDTLFVITGDHTQKIGNRAYDNEIGHYRVPLLLFHPRAKWPVVDPKRVVQHADILPTVLDVLDIDPSILSRVGTSVFARPEDAFVVNRVKEEFWYLSNQVFLKLGPDGKIAAYSQDGELNLQPVVATTVSADVVRFQAYLQYVVNGIIENRLVEGHP